MAARIHHHRRNENAITTVVCKATNPVVAVPVVRAAALEDGDRDTPPFTPFAYLSQMFCKGAQLNYVIIVIQHQYT